MEKQRSRVDWLKAGDRNTRVFHAKAKLCSRTNKIMHLKREYGSLCMIPKEIEEMTTSFYRNLFTAQDHNELSEVAQFIPRKVIDEMSNMLNIPFSNQEV
jgi:hypothetical protein